MLTTSATINNKTLHVQLVFNAFVRVLTGILSMYKLVYKDNAHEMWLIWSRWYLELCVFKLTSPPADMLLSKDKELKDLPQNEFE